MESSIKEIIKLCNVAIALLGIFFSIFFFYFYSNSNFKNRLEVRVQLIHSKRSRTRAVEYTYIFRSFTTQGLELWITAFSVCDFREYIFTFYGKKREELEK